MRDMADMLNSLIDAFEELNLKYVIVRGVAVVAWGNLRTTRDVDIVLSIEDEDAERFVLTLARYGFDVEKEDVLRSLEERSHLTVFDTLSEFHADVKAVYDEQDVRVLERRREVRVGDRRLYVASPEDIIAMKLVYGSEQDVKDAESVYLRQKDRLDVSYLRTLCDGFGVLPALESLMEESRQP